MLRYRPLALTLTDSVQTPALAPQEPPATHETQERILDNGLRVILRESHRAPVVELQIWANVGSADERPGEEGLAHFHEHMLFKGTERRGVGEVAGEIEGLGGQINAYTSFDVTVYHATLPASAWRDGLDVLTDAVQHSVFDPAEVEREREVVLEEIRRSDDTPGHVLGDLAFKACYPDHPYGLPILGPADNVAQFDQAKVRRFFERWYVPNHMMVVAVGDFDATEVMTEIERLFGDRPPGEAERSRSDASPQSEMRVALLRKPFEGHRVDLSWPAARFSDRDATHLDLLAYVLGECESSRLVRRVREEKGLVDRIDAGAYTPLDRGVFSIGFETDEARFLEATERIIEETERLRREPVSEAELSRARINFLASEQFDRESVSGLASKLGSFESFGGGWRRETETIEILKSATPADLLGVAKTYLKPEWLTFSALLPEAGRDAAQKPSQPPAADIAPAIDEASIKQAVQKGLEAAARSARAAATIPPDESAQAQPRGGRPAAAEGTTEGGAKSGTQAPAERTTAPQPVSQTRFDAELPNGLRLHIERRPEIPIASVRYACLGGLLSETAQNAGLSRFVSALWTRGAGGRNAAEFAREMESLASEIDGFSGRNSIGLTLDCLSESLEPALELFADALFEPTFENAEVESERRETLAAIDRRQDRLGQRAFQLFSETEFEAHPYRLSVGGESETVRGFTRADLTRQADRLLRARSSAISIVGDVDPDAVTETLARRFGALEGRRDALELPPAEPRTIGVREATLRKDRAQAHLVVGFRGLQLDDPDRFALELISQLLAGQGGRLFLELRDRQSLAYTVSASNVEGLAEGYFSVYIATAPEKLDRARAGILEELARLRNDLPDPGELARAIRYGTGSFMIDGQRGHARAAHMALDSIYGLGPDHAQDYPDRLEAVRPEDIRRVAQRVLRSDAMTVCAVHP